MMRRLIAVLVTLVVGAGAVAATATTAPPAAWPNNSSVQPQIDTWPNALRIFGANRYQTAMATTLVLRGDGADDSYPYGSPDSGSANGWWGLDSCPRAVIIVAGDNPADALAANSLSDPTGNSTEPYLQRSAAADPVFFPPGGFARVDTDYAPILTTTSARQDATQLDIATRLAAQDMSRGACTTAKQAIIVGGVRAVPATVEAELVSIGYDEVFRIAGSSRYQTARLVAESLGTADAPGSPPRTSCVDSTSRGGTKASFYANSVVEYRASATECRLLNRTVVLADGMNGIDALASGWWTSYWQVPILLTDDDDTLPTSTRDALQTLDVDTLVALGGTARISDVVIDDALELSGASEVIRISGDDRYATSVAMARHFGGWFSSGGGADAEGSAVCVAASTGGSRTEPGLGWADALAAGPWCARFGVARATTGGPSRALSPVGGGSGAVSATAGNSRALGHSLVPMVLVPAGASAPTATVSGYLQSVFAPGDDWCDGEVADDGCLTPGFAVAFGGSALVTDAALGIIDRTVSGGRSDMADRAADTPAPFWTRLNMAPVFDDPYPASVHGDDQRICVVRGEYQRARWLVTDTGSLSAFDLLSGGAYAEDADGEPRTRGTGRPQCVGLEPDDKSVSVWMVPITGAQPTSAQVSALDLDPDTLFALSGDVAQGPATSALGPDSATDASNGGTSTWTFSGALAGITATSEGESATVTDAEIEISLLRGRDGDTDAPDTFTAEFTLTTSDGTVRGEATGEGILVGGVWRLRGVVTFARGTWTFDSGRGGFAAEIRSEVAGDSSDDSVVWRVDGSS